LGPRRNRHDHVTTHTSRFVTLRHKSRGEFDTSTDMIHALTLRVVRRHLAVERDDHLARDGDALRLDLSVSVIA